MDAVHLMRAITGRDLIVKVEGCYHGHHDSVMVSVSNRKDEIGPSECPYSAPSGTGIPRAITDLILIVPYNDLDALERIFEEHRGQIADQPSASAPRDATCAARVISPSGGVPSLSTSSGDVPFPTPRPGPPARRPFPRPSLRARRNPTPWPPRQDTSRWPVLRSPRGRRTAPGAQDRP